MKSLKRLSIIWMVILPWLIYAGEIGEILSALPFEMSAIEEPVFPDLNVNILDFGGKAGGKDLNTKAFESAIRHCAERGGGKITVPAGLWLTGPIVFDNNINLHLESGSVIVFSDNLDHYTLMNSNWEGQRRVRYRAPVYGKDLENIAITGNGIIDGSGDAWRPVKKFKMTDNQWQNLIAQGGKVVDGAIWWPSENAARGATTVRRLAEDNVSDPGAYKEAGEYLRPVMVNFVNCKNILLDGPTFQNSPAWNIHPLMCENIIIRNVTIRNPWYSQNGDGLDLESCKNAVVYNSSFDVGDDAMCLKSGKDAYGRKRGIPSENIVFDNCIVYHGHGGFTVGSEMSGGVRNIMVRNCTFIGTDVGLRFKSTRGRGGTVENIYIENINMMNIAMEAIRFNMFYNYQSPVPEDGDEGLIAFADRPENPVTEETPHFRNIHISNIKCMGAGQAILLQGLPEMPLKEMTLKNIFISAKKGFVSVDAQGIALNDITIESQSGTPFSFFNSRDIKIEKTVGLQSQIPLAAVYGPKSDRIEFYNMADQKKKDLIKMGDNVPSGAIIWK